MHKARTAESRSEQEREKGRERGRDREGERATHAAAIKRLIIQLNYTRRRCRCRIRQMADGHIKLTPLPGTAEQGRTRDHGAENMSRGLRCAFRVANCKRNHIKSCLFNLHYKADARSLNSLVAGHVCVLKTIKRKMFDKYT